MNNFLGTFTKAIMANVISIVGVVLAFILTYFLFIVKEKRAIRKLEYEKIWSLSLVSMDDRIRDKIKITYDGKLTDNIFSFRFRIRNRGKMPVKRIPIVVEFNDENVQILDIKGTFESKDRVRYIELSLDDTKKNRGKFVVSPGLEKDEEGIFDVFTKDNSTGDLTSFVIKLGEETLGTQWRYSEKKEIMPTVDLITMVLIVLLTCLVTIVPAALIVVYVPVVEKAIGPVGIGVIVAAIVATYLTRKWKYLTTWWK